MNPGRALSLIVLFLGILAWFGIFTDAALNGIPAEDVKRATVHAAGLVGGALMMAYGIAWEPKRNHSLEEYS